MARKKGPNNHFNDGGFSSDSTESSPRGSNLGLLPHHHHHHLTGERGVALPWQQQFASSLRDPSGFVRINARAKLHDRFYLRTPGQGGVESATQRAERENCECAMCRLEMEVALMAHLHTELGVSVDAIAAAHIRASLQQQQFPQLQQQENASNGLNRGRVSFGPNLPEDGQRGPLSAVVEEDCVARPNSADVQGNVCW
jgi:hypothetical protein